MLIWSLTLGAIVATFALILTGKQFVQLLKSIPKRNEDFDALSFPADTSHA